MKKVLLIAALIGFTAVGSYAQDKKDDAYVKKSRYSTVHKTRAHGVSDTRNNMNIQSENSFMGNYPPKAPSVPASRENNVYLRPPFVPFISNPTTDPEYYLRMRPDDNCRWNCLYPY